MNKEIYLLAKEEHKTASMALADPLGLEVSHADRKLCRQKTQENPGASLKHTAWSISFNHQQKLPEIQHTQEVMRSVSS